MDKKQLLLALIVLCLFLLIPLTLSEEGVFSGITYDTSTIGASGLFQAITSNGTFMWGIDGTPLHNVYKLWMNGTYTGSYFTTTGTMSGITNNNTFFWILSSNTVSKFWMNGTNTTEMFTPSAAYSCSRGITTNGTFLWLNCGSNGNSIRVYLLNGTLYNSFTVNAEIGQGRGIYTNNTFIWISDDTTDRVYKYWMNGTYTNNNWDTSVSGNIGPKSITMNDTFFFLTDTINETIFLYYIERDITAPTFTSIPNNVSMFYLNQTLSVDFNATDDVSFGYYRINDTTRFSITQAGLLTNKSPIAAGNYAVNVTINDTTNNINWTIFTLEVKKASYYNCGVYFNTTSPMNYLNRFIVYTNCSTAYTLYRNGTSISNNSVQSLAISAYNFSVFRTDTANYTNVYNSQQFIVTDTTPPTSTITMTSPPGSSSYTNNTWTQSDIQIIITASDGSGVGVNTLSFPIYCIDTTNTCEPDTLPNTFPLTHSSEGTYYIRYYSNDTLGNKEVTQFRVLKIDTTGPVITLQYPTPSLNLSYNTFVPLNFTITDSGAGVSMCRYSLNGGASNTTISCSANTTINVSTGDNTVTIFSNDSVNNWNSNSVTFRTDLTNPLISFGTGIQNNTYKNNRFIYTNISVTETYEKNVTFYLYFSNYTIYNTSTYTDARRSINWTVPTDGAYFYNVTIFDYSSRSNSTVTYKTTEDTVLPTYTQVSINNTVAGTITRFGIYINDNVLLSLGGAYIFSTNNSGSWVNDSAVLFTTTPNWGNSTKVLNATRNLVVGYRWYMNDTAGNVNSTPIYIVTTIPVYINNSIYEGVSASGTGTRTNLFKRNINQLMDSSNLIGDVIYIIKNPLQSVTEGDRPTRKNYIFKNSNNQITASNLADIIVRFIRGNNQGIQSNNFIDIHIQYGILVDIMQEMIMDNILNKLINFNREISQDSILSNIVFKALGIDRQIDSEIRVCDYPFNTTGLVNWWKLDSNNVNQADSFGNITLVALNGTLFNNNGKMAGDYLFDGNNDYLQGNETTSLNESEGSISLWVYFNESNENQTIIMFGNESASGVSAAYDSLSIRIDDDNKIYGGWITSTEPDLAVSSAVSTGTWYHVVLWWSLSSNQVRLYVNGVKITGDVLTGDNKNKWTNYFRIGASMENSLTTNSFNGSIDEVMIFNRSLSDAEVQTIYNLQSNQHECIYDTNYSFSRIINQAVTEDNFFTRLLTIFRNNNQVITEDNFITRLFSGNRNNNQEINEDNFITKVNQFTRSTFVSITYDNIVRTTKQFLRFIAQEINIITTVAKGVSGTITNLQPGNNTITQFFNFSANLSDDDYLSNSTFYFLNASDKTLISKTNSSYSGEKVTEQNWIVDLLEGIYNWWVELWDIDNSKTTSGNMTVTIDRNDPNIVIFTPFAGTYNYNTSLPLNFSITDTNIDSCWYNLDNTANITLSCSANTTFNTTENVHTLYMFANDTSGRESTEIVSFTVSLAPPGIVQNYPTNDKWWATSNVYFNYTPSDASLDECRVFTNTTGVWHLNYTDTSPVTDVLNNLSIRVPDGYYIWNVWCNDSGGSGSWADSVNNHTFYVDTVFPQITYGTGVQNNTNTTRTFIVINVSITENNEKNVTFNLYDSNHIIVNSTTYTDNRRTINWTSLLDDIYYFNVTVFDHASNSNTTATYLIRLDDTAPTITIYSPLSQNYGNNNSMLLNYTVVDNLLSISSCYYYIDFANGTSIKGAEVLTNCVNDTFELPGGDNNYTLTIVAKDSLLNLQTKTVAFGIRTNSPVIVLSPPDDSYSPTTLNHRFNFTVTTNADNISSCEFWTNSTGTWHKNQTKTTVLYDGSKNTFSAINLAEGSYIWNVWCNDSFNNNEWAFINATYTVDTTKPNVTIITSNNSAVSTSFTFNYNITDTNRDVCYYNLNSTTGSGWYFTPNQTLSCTSTSKSVTVTADTYNLFIWGFDKAGNTNSSWIRLTATAPETEGGSSGGTSTVATNKTWNMTTENGGQIYKFQIPKKGERTRQLIFTNSDTTEIEITITCTDEPCEFITLSQTELTLPIGTTIQTTVDISVLIPKDTEDGQYIANIIATDENNHQEIVTVEMNVVSGVPIVDIFAKFAQSKQIGSSNIKIPYIVIFILVFAIVFALFNYVILRNINLGLGLSIVLGIIAGLVSFMIF